ncbi:MAG TPA: DUF1844 domain-containing protein [Candidatus Eisenbacteria bacterium]|nr:DUF1844 domain-containing protein [Candidatus Eisenbacteria bacterium]
MADKKVDDSWKESVEKEKSVPAAGPSAPAPKSAHEHGPDCAHGHEHGAETGAELPPQSDFSIFLSTLGMQALSALGEIPDPGTNLKRTDLPTAHYLIDTLILLLEKTKGNLTPDEDALLGGMLYELQMKFVEKSKAPRA